MNDKQQIVVIVGAMAMLIWSTVLFNCWLPKWFCDKMGWHLPPKAQGFNGCSFNGTCPRCGKEVMQDSQGNWF